MKKALIIVDVQYDFCPGGALEVKNGNEVIPVINSLINSGKFDLIVATKDWHPRNHKSFASNHKNKNPYDVIKLNKITQVLWPDHCIQRTKGSMLHKELKTERIDKVIRKGKDPEIDSYSGFFDNDHKSSTGLSEYLNKNRIEEIYITGLATDYCVKFTAIDGVREGFTTYVIKDSVKAVNLQKDDAKNSFAEMRANKINLVFSKSLLKPKKAT